MAFVTEPFKIINISFVLSAYICNITRCPLSPFWHFKTTSTIGAYPEQTYILHFFTTSRAFHHPQPKAGDDIRNVGQTVWILPAFLKVFMGDKVDLQRTTFLPLVILLSEVALIPFRTYYRQLYRC